MAKPGEMPAVIVDICHAREQLGYWPSVSLADGLAAVWKDFTVADTVISTVTTDACTPDR
jgi:hypothetical protein